MQQTKDTRATHLASRLGRRVLRYRHLVYYVPGILYGNGGDNTPFFVLLTTIGFIPLALKYSNILR